MGVLAGPDQGGERGELAVPGHVKTVEPKPRSGFPARGAQRISLRIAQHDRLGLRCRRERSTDEIRERRIGKAIATAADGVGDEVRLMDCCVKMPPQRHLLRGKYARDQAAGEFLHDAASNEPILGQNRANGHEHQQADAQHERRDQGKGTAVSIQMLFGRDVDDPPESRRNAGRARRLHPGR